MTISQAFLTGPVTKRLGEFRAMVLGLSVECILLRPVRLRDAVWMVFALPESHSASAGSAPPGDQSGDRDR